LTKNAVNTLESLNYPEEITDTAREIITAYEASGNWSLMEKRQSKLDDKDRNG